MQHVINQYALGSVQLPGNIPTSINYIPQSQINEVAAKEKGNFQQWLEDNPELKNNLQKAWVTFLTVIANRNSNTSTSTPTTNSSGGSTTTLPPVIISPPYVPSSGTPKKESSNTNKIILGSLSAAVIGYIAYKEIQKRKQA